MNRFHSSSLLRTSLSTLALAALLAGQSVGQSADHAVDATSFRSRIATAPVQPPTHVLFDQPGDGRIWALGSTYKASFGHDGFVYVPFLGSAAPRNYPVQFVLRSVRVGRQELALTTARVEHRDARVVFDRGPVQEIYDLATDAVEQSFVVDGVLPGDVEIELELATELAADRGAANLSFGNHLGGVDYGTAFLVLGEDKLEIATELAGSTLRLRVPGALRRPGPIVVDPIIRTRSLTPTLMGSDLPDVAYDATTDRWAVTWAHMFSQTDHDVVVELRTGANDPVPGSFQGIEISSTSFSWPRIGNLNSVDRFLVAMERFRPQDPVGQQYTVFGRTIDAASPNAMGSLRQISPPSTQNQNSVDVGGDPGTGTNWTVVWVHGTDINARQVDQNGVPAPNTIPVETTTSPCINPQISLSNGNGLCASPRWVVVYNLQRNATDWDVYGAVLDVNGNITVSHRSIASSSNNDLYTYVSSPMTDLGGNPAFLVSYERQTAPPEMVVQLVDTSLNSLVSEVNLTRRFGFSGIYCRVESDGSRFAATCQIGTSMRVGTLAYVNNGLALHESLQNLGVGASPHLASKRSGGGPSADYAIATMSSNTTPTSISLSLYQGRASSGGLSWRSTGCGIDLLANGQPLLGRSVLFSLSNVGAEFAGVMLGAPALAPLPCGGCSFGLDLGAPLIWNAPTLSLSVPAWPGLVGYTLAAQGFALGSGPCQSAALRLSDTIEVTIQ